MIIDLLGPRMHDGHAELVHSLQSVSFSVSPAAGIRKMPATVLGLLAKQRPVQIRSLNLRLAVKAVFWPVDVERPTHPDSRISNLIRNAGFFTLWVCHQSVNVL